MSEAFSRLCILVSLAGVLVAGGAWGQMPELGVRCEAFGKARDGSEVEQYTLTNGRGLEAKVMTWGATLRTVSFPDRNGKPDIITLHCDTLDDYLRGHPLFGSVVGRFAGRIAEARLLIDGQEAFVVANAGKHHIHGGREGFQAQVWKARPLQDARSAGVKLTHSSPDGHAGFPGRLDVTMIYKVTADNELVMEYTAQTDKPTHLNLTNHAYWNLGGHGSGEVFGHVVTLNADRYLAADAAKIPTGEVRTVEGTGLDFRTPQTIESRLALVENRDIDHCFVLNRRPGESMTLCARVVEPKSGRVMEVRTTQPGVQVFTAKVVTNQFGAGGKTYGPYHGLCFETQHYPNTPNIAAFPSTLLRPGETFHEVTIHTFSHQ